MVNERVLRVRLQHYRASGVEQVLVRAVLTLMLRVRPRSVQELVVIVDTGTPITTIPVGHARDAGLVIPARTMELELLTATGKARQIRHPGRIQGKIMGLEGWDFDWPCQFAEHDGPPPTAQLGLVGVIDNFRLTLDGQYSLESPHGWLIVERTTRLGTTSRGSVGFHEPHGIRVAPVPRYNTFHEVWMLAEILRTILT